MTRGEFEQAAYLGEELASLAACPGESARARQLLRSRYAGATVVECSAPVRSGNYPGLFIPCRLQMADGSTEELHLALRNDNPQRSWVVDGGL